MKIYAVIEWFYDGDGYLVNYYLGVKRDYKDALLLNIEGYELLSEKEIGIVYGKREPHEFGGYYSEPKIEIREEEL